MTIKLLRCPFCGAEGVHRTHEEIPTMHIVGCNNPDCIGVNAAYDFVSEEAAAAAWNKRPDTPFEAYLQASQELDAATDNFYGQAKCWCEDCRPVSIYDMRMVLCPTCGNKRCPHAKNHGNACTGSNEPGQVGSAYENQPPEDQHLQITPATMTNWIELIHDNERAMGDRLQSLSSTFMFLLKGKTFPPFVIREQRFDYIEAQEELALLRELGKASVGSCNCLTKTPDSSYHKEGCRYRAIDKAMQLLERK